MSVPIQPQPDYVVVQADEPATKTASGLYLPETAVEKPKTAKVVAAGKGVGDVKVGDRILYKNDYEAVKVSHAGQDYIIIHKDNIIATVK